MKFYAILNENKICTGISQLSGEVIQENMIEISSVDMTYMWKKYDSTAKTWSTDTFEPASTAPIDEFTTVKNQVDALNIAIANLVGGVN